MTKQLYITECPRDAMQGLLTFIPTEIKIKYLNLLLKVGYDRLDFGSFVSPKAIPQMRDTAELMDHLDLEQSKTELLAIIANVKGALDASQFQSIRFLGFPFSVSETFQLRNTNATREQALDRVKEIQEICIKSNKKALIYLSMGFGNPYGDPWEPEIVASWADQIQALGIKHFSLADTTGNSSAESIQTLYTFLTNSFPSVEWSMHLHSSMEEAPSKINAALQIGCNRLDSAIRGFGGCPMAKDDLVGNIATEMVINLSSGTELAHQLNLEAFQQAYQFSSQIFH